MLRLLPYVLKNLWRNRARTFLTVSGSAVALFIYAVVGSVREGLDRLTADRAGQRALIVFQANRFCPSTSRLPEHYADRIRKLEGVRDVVPIQVFMNNCRASLDLVVFHGVPAEQLRSVRELRLISGSWERFTGERRAALVGRSLARRRGLSAGQTFSVGETNVVVAGIFVSDAPGEEQYLYCHLEYLQRTRGLNNVGTVTQHEVLLKDGTDADAMCRRIDDLFRDGPVATDTRLKGVFEANAVGDLVGLIGLARYLGLACVGLVLALVATTTVIAVQDRVREHAVLQTLGFTGPHIFGFVLAESALTGAAGGVLGVGAALLVLQFGGLAVGSEGVSISFAATPRLALTGFGLSTLVGVLAGLAPAARAARAEIVASLRAV
jgi:putative ABC transport system permease protein